MNPEGARTAVARSTPAGTRRRAGAIRAGYLAVCGLAAVAITISCAKREEKFPDQIPAVKEAIGSFLRAVSLRDKIVLDSITTDDRLYGDVVYILGSDSLSVLSRRIQNPIDSAHVIMTIAPRDSSGAAAAETYSLELFMKKRGDYYWIVGHRLTRSPL